MKDLYKNIGKLLKNPIAIIGFFIGICMVLFPGLYFFEPELVFNNIGAWRVYTEYILLTLISVLFGIFLGATLYRLKYFSTSKSDSGLGMFGGLLGVLIAGCPSCSITLASYMGLAGLVSIFPYEGLELKVLSVFILLYACYSTIINLEVCKIKTKKEKT